MLASLDRHFQEKGLPFSIRKDKAFEASRRTLNGKAIELREAGLGKRKNKADSLTEEDEEKLWVREEDLCRTFLQNQGCHNCHFMWYQ